MYEIIRLMFEGESPDSIFEIGCGNGSFMKELAEESQKQIMIGGIDIDERNREGFSANFPGKELILQDANNSWPVEDKSYDIVFAVGVLIYIPDPFPILREALRVAKHKVILAEFHDETTDEYGYNPYAQNDLIMHRWTRNYKKVAEKLGAQVEIIKDKYPEKTIIKLSL